MEITNEFLGYLSYLPQINDFLAVIAGILVYFLIVSLLYWVYRFFNMFF